MFKKTLLALSIASLSSAAFAGVSTMSANGTGVGELGIGDTTDNDSSIVVSAEGVQAELLLDLGSKVDLAKDGTPDQAAVLTFAIGDVATTLLQYASVDKIRLTLTGADFNPATSLVASVNAADNTADDDLVASAGSGVPKFTASNVVEFTYEGDGSNIAAADTITISGLVLANFSKSAGSRVTAKLEVVSNVGGQVIDTASATLVNVQSQIASFVSSSQRFNGVVDVTQDRMLFENLVDQDTLVVKTLTDVVDAYSVDMTASAPIYTVKGDFSFLDSDGNGELDAGVTVTAAGANKFTFAEDFQSVKVEMAALAAHDGLALDITPMTLTIKTDGERVLPVGSFTTDSTFNYNDAAANVRAYARNDINSGLWVLNGTSVNVPYIPVGFDNLSPNIEIANSTIDGDITLEGFDQNGNEYGPIKLDFQAKADTVTKVSEANIVDAFGLTEGTKLSLTLTVNAPKGISVYPYYRENDVRVSLPTSQYRAVQCVASGTIATTQTDADPAKSAGAAVTDTDGAGTTAALVYGNTSGTVSTSCTKDFN